MRRGFSLYAPLIGAILLGVSLLILASFMSEEVARVRYLRAIRASYAYLLPTHSMRYDALTAFSVAARIYFQNAPVELGEAPDIGEFLKGFLSGFATATAGTGIKEARIIWEKGDVTIQEDVRDTYVLLKVTVNRPPGPVYSITVDAGGGREERVEVPIFEQGTERIYVPYPYGRIQQIARSIRNALAGTAEAGRIAYGYCSRVLEERGGTEEVYVVGKKAGRGSRGELRSALKPIAEDVARPLGARIEDVRISGVRGRHEVKRIPYVQADKTTLLCAVPYDKAHRVEMCGEGVFYVLGRETDLTCAYVTSIGVEGSVSVDGEEYTFDVVIPLSENPAPSEYRTVKISTYNIKDAIDQHTQKPAYCCLQECKQWVDDQCNPQCERRCCTNLEGELECDWDCYHRCRTCLETCAGKCRGEVGRLLGRIRGALKKAANNLGELDIYCPTGIRTAILCDAEKKVCHYRNMSGGKR